MVLCPNHQNRYFEILYNFSIPVCVRLVWAINLDSNVVRLLLCQRCQLCTQRSQVEASHLLVKLLWEEVDVVLVLLCLLPVLEEIQLCKSLVSEGARHDERRVASCTTQIQQTATCENNDSMAIGEFK